jgi:ABC-type uncharacterized transport system fused permease/ATPase subunit
VQITELGHINLFLKPFGCSNAELCLYYQIMGASGSGKTSLLRAIAGLWTSGSGTIRRYTLPTGVENNGAITEESGSGNVDSSRRGSIFFLPQKPYMVLGTLRQQLLYPTWNDFSTTQEPSDSKGICHSACG